MTDKPIIINGVDVSGCIYYQYNMCAATKDNYGDCSFYCKDYDMNDCYYKQLKRKEQECDQFKAENEELNKEIAFGNNGTLSDKIRAEVFKELNNKNKKLSKTLIEIKEIAENVQSFVDITLEDDVYTEMDKILQKISECEV